MDRVRQAIRVRHYSRRTEEAYAGWIRRYLAYHEMRHPSQLGATHVSEFLSWLATRGHVSASTQNQTLSAILFLYRVVLSIEIGVVEYDIRTLQELLGHADVSTTMIYTHVLNRGV